MNNTAFESLAAVSLSGIAGSVAGTVCTQLGVDHSTQATFAGFAGFMAGQAFHFSVLLWATRYKPSKAAEMIEGE